MPTIPLKYRLFISNEKKKRYIFIHYGLLPMYFNELKLDE